MPSNDVLLERLTNFGEQLEAHREEARAASARTEAKLDEVVRLGARIEPLEERVVKLEVTVQGAEDKPGLKGRQDRSERTLGLMVWAISAVALVAIAKVVEWVSSIGHPTSGGKP